MNDASGRHLAENEVLFREINKEAQAFVERDAKDTYPSGRPLRFYCECSDIACTKRILLPSGLHRRLHGNRRQFVVLPGHAHPEIERVVKQGEDYVVVEKLAEPPQPSEVVNPRSLLE